VLSYSNPPPPPTRPPSVLRTDQPKFVRGVSAPFPQVPINRASPSPAVSTQNKRVSAIIPISNERARMSDVPLSEVLPIGRPERVSGGAESSHSASGRREFVVSMIESDDGGEREFQETLARARAATAERIKARRIRAQAASKA
jgi:hypothetical protein